MELFVYVYAYKLEYHQKNILSQGSSKPLIIATSYIT